MSNYEVLGAVDNDTAKEIAAQAGGVLKSIADIFKPAPKTELPVYTPGAGTPPWMMPQTAPATPGWVWAFVGVLGVGILGGLAYVLTKRTP